MATGVKVAHDRFAWNGASPDEACARLGVDPGHGLELVDRHVGRRELAPAPAET